MTCHNPECQLCPAREAYAAEGRCYDAEEIGVCADADCPVCTVPEPCFGHVFVALADSVFLCEACARGREIDLGDDATETWEVGGDGWLAPVVCADCRLSIPVIVNGEQQ